jgi:SAM-dependent methyltransferase
MDAQDHVISYLSASIPVSMGDWWFDVASTGHFWIARRFQVLTKLANDAIERAHSAAEIGCGNGLLQKEIEDRYDKPVVGFDLNELALRKNVSRLSPLYCYDIHQRNSEFQNRFDLLLLCDVLEHITNESEFLQSVKFHLAHSGVLVVNVPALQVLFSDYDRAAGHVRRYSLKQLVKVAEENGFRVRKATYWGLPLLPLLLLRKGMKLDREDGSAGFDSRVPGMNFLLSRVARCEPVPQRLVGTSVMAVLEKSEL